MGRLTFCALLAALVAPAVAAPAAFTVSDQLCTYQVAYDPADYDRARLEATVAFLTDSEPPLEFGPTLEAPADAARLDLGDYQSECGAREGLFQQPKFVDLPGIEDLRQRKIAELRDFCTMTEKKLEAAKGDLAALRDYALAAPHCGRYVEALSSGPDALRAAWPDFAREFCRNNGDPKGCTDRHMKDAAAPDGAARMKLTLVTFGWGNCANAHTLYSTGGEPGGAGSEGMRKRLLEALSRKVSVRTTSCVGED